LTELGSQQFDPIKSKDVADELQRKLLVFDNYLGNFIPHRILKELAPRSPTRALQIDDGDLAVGSRPDGAIELRNGPHFAAPNRCFRLSSPGLSSAETIACTTMFGWSSGRNCERHSTTLPSPLGLTPSVPV
jgi:hypothetical protein